MSAATRSRTDRVYQVLGEAAKQVRTREKRLQLVVRRMLERVAKKRNRATKKRLAR